MMMDGGLTPHLKRSEPQPQPSFEGGSINRLDAGKNKFALCNIVSDHIEKYPGLELSLKQLISLRLFNRYALSGKRDKEDVSDIFEEIESLAKTETDLSDPNNPLPTIGIELEVPMTREVMRLKEVFSRFGINHWNEQMGLLHEASPSYSYSPKIQAMILQELAKIGFVPMEGTDDPKYQHNSDNLAGYKIDNRDPLSLHINLGLSCFSGEEHINRFVDEMSVFSDAMIFAYTSTDRIRSKKTRRAFDPRKAAVSSSKIDNTPRFIMPIRLELTSAEFKDSSSYRALFDAQYLGAALNSYVICKDSDDPKPLDLRLANIFQQFLEASNELFEEYHHDCGQIFASGENRDETISLIENSDIQASFRSLMQQYRQIVAQAIKQETEE